MTWDYTGEGFIKELDFGRVWLRFNEADEGTNDDIIAEWKEDAKKFLQEAMARPISLCGSYLGIVLTCSDRMAPLRGLCTIQMESHSEP